MRDGSVEQTLNNRPSRDYLRWRSIPYKVMKPRHNCGYQEMLADKSLVQLSPKKLCQTLKTQTRMLIDNPCIERWLLNEGVRGTTEGAEGVCNSIGRTTTSTNQYPRNSHRLNNQTKSTQGENHVSN